jgi:hypothetical protein
MDLNELYKEIEKAEIDLNAKRLKYIKEALVENGGSIKLKFKKWGEDNNAFDFDDQFPVIIEIAGIPMFLTEVYVKKNGFRMVLLDYDDMTLGDFDNTGENEQVGYFRGSEKEGQVFCDMITERIEKYEKRMSYDKGKLNN